MNRNFIKVLSFLSVAALSCTIASAADIQMKEVKTESTVIPAITMPAKNAAEVENEVLQPAAEVKKEAVKAVEEKTEASKTDVKETVEKAKETTEIKTEASSAEVPRVFEALQKVELAPKDKAKDVKPAVNNEAVKTDATAEVIKEEAQNAEAKVEQAKEAVSDVKEEVKSATEEAVQKTTDAVQKTTEEVKNAAEEVKKEVKVKEVKKTKKAPSKVDTKTLFENIRPEVKGGAKK